MVLLKLKEEICLTSWIFSGFLCETFIDEKNILQGIARFYGHPNYSIKACGDVLSAI